jgi:hypothetical protein
MREFMDVLVLTLMFLAGVFLLDHMHIISGLLYIVVGLVHFIKRYRKPKESPIERMVREASKDVCPPSDDVVAQNTQHAEDMRTERMRKEATSHAATWREPHRRASDHKGPFSAEEWNKRIANGSLIVANTPTPQTVKTEPHGPTLKEVVEKSKKISLPGIRLGKESTSVFQKRKYKPAPNRILPYYGKNSSFGEHQTLRAWRTQKRREIRAVEKAMETFNMGAAATPTRDSGEVMRTIRKMREQMSVKNWGR